MIYIQSIFLLLFLICAQGEAAIIQHQQYEALNYYNILGVSCDASSQDIRDAYKKSALRWHPDKNTENEGEAHACFILVQEAYATLSDIEKRKKYDLDQAVSCDEYCLNWMTSLMSIVAMQMKKPFFRSS